MNRIAAAICLASLTACGTAPAPWTRDQQAAATTRSYQGVRPAEALKAAETVARLTDPRGVRFDYRPGGFRAQRPVFAYMVIAAMTGDYFYDAQVQPTAGGSNIQIKTFNNINGITGSGVFPGSGSFVESKGVYDLYFARIDHLLGRRPDWVTCQAAPKVLGVPSHQLEPLCVAAADTAPASTN